jgi:hypothetical protein
MASPVKLKQPDAKPAEVVEPFICKRPCDWVITELENGISAVSTTTQETFEGTLVEFNKRLRG